nr:11886_t:CDS:2 [Entrophospora candida]
MSTNSKTSLQAIPDDQLQADLLRRRNMGSRIFILNRPTKANALTLDVIRSITPQLQAWNLSNLCNVIIIKGTGNKFFCAGGDVVNLVKQLESDPNNKPNVVTFFREEYQLDHLIATVYKPFVAIIDGATMGGGVGISALAPFRIATENTIFAMPETKIGLFPDVGGSFFLPRMDGELGTYLALTCENVVGIDVFLSGVASHYVPSQRLQQLEDRLSELESDDHEVINSAIEEFVSEPPKEHKYSFGTEWSKKTLETLKKHSPTSLVVTLKELREGKKKDIVNCFKLEYNVVQKFLEKSDFKEGVRALLIDKDNNPKWNPSTINDINEEEIINFYFNSEKDCETIEFLNELSFEKHPHYKFSLPSEEEIRMVITGETPDAGSLSMSKSEVVDFFLKNRKSKIGVPEKVLEVLDRKTSSLNGGLKWKD